MPAQPITPAAPPTAEAAPDVLPDTSPSSEALAPDFYQEGPYIVFTAAYHLRRGYCCNSNCRHCPYRDVAETA